MMDMNNRPGLENSSDYVSHGPSLKYRRQFVAGFVQSDRFPDWQHYEFPEHGLHIYAHPDLELSAASSEDRGNRIVLLGFAFDPEYPERSNEGIISELATKSSSIGDLANGVSGLGGRFVIIASLLGQLYIFHDACGLRTVYYANSEGRIFLASQPLLFSEFFPLRPSDHYRLFHDSSYRKTCQQYYLPAGLSLYENIHQLIPNHYLDMMQVTQKRYWPNQPIPRQTLETAVRVSADLLTGLLLAANHRYKLGYFITAGLDSRLLLGAAGKIKGDIIAFTMKLQGMTEQHRDVVIPRSISENSEGIVWKLLDCNTKVDPEFYQLCVQNVDLFREEAAKIAFAMMKQFPQDMLAVKGNCSEIARCACYEYGVHDDIVSPSQLAIQEPGWEKVPFIVEHLEKWMKSAIQTCKDTNVDILDLFYWEQRLGTWLAQTWLEKDIAQESFSPFNYRPLMTTMLGVPVKYRRKPDYLLYQHMIKHLWPGLLNWPVNPESYSLINRVKNNLRRLMLKIGIYGYVRWLFRSTLWFKRLQ